MKSFQISHDWIPTVKNIDALPERLRKYIFDLKNSTDFATLIGENAQLRKDIASLREENNALRKWCEKVVAKFRTGDASVLRTPLPAPPCEHRRPR